MKKKITIKNFTSLTEEMAILRVALYLSDRKNETDKDGYNIKVRNDPKKEWS